MLGEGFIDHCMCVTRLGGAPDYPHCMKSRQGRKSGLLPVVDENTVILILGALPSDMSIAAQQYYANPGNDFWKLIGAALNQQFENAPYEVKIDLLKVNRIGLWDAYHSCIRPGSIDADISAQELNDFGGLKSIAPNIRLVCFNGQEAAKADETLKRLEYRTHLLPSSSPANRTDQIRRESRWKEAIHSGLQVSSKTTILMKTSDYFAELHVAGRLADAGWDIYFPHRDKGFDFVISKRIDDVPLLRPVQVKGKYPTGEKTDKTVYGYVGKLTQRHPEMVLAIPYFSASSPNTPVCIAFMPPACVKPHSRGFRCQPATYRNGEPKPRREYQKFFDQQGIVRLDSLTWKDDTPAC
jgi:hypoxanthine-DNA glycosylase